MTDLFFNKVAVLRPGTLLKKKLWYRCFPVNFAKFLRTLFLQNTFGGCFLIFTEIDFGFLFAITIKIYDLSWSTVKKMFIENRLCNLSTYVFKGHVEIVKIYKFNVILNRIEIMGFFVNTKQMHKHNMSFLIKR